MAEQKNTGSKKTTGVKKSEAPKFLAKIWKGKRTAWELERGVQDLLHAINEAAIVAITDAKGVILDVNETFCKISKYSRQELLGQNHRILKSNYHTKEFYENMWKTISSGKVWRGEIKNRAKDGTHYWVFTTIVPFLNKRKHPYQYISIRIDITEWKKLTEESQEHL